LPSRMGCSLTCAMFQFSQVGVSVRRSHLLVRLLVLREGISRCSLRSRKLNLRARQHPVCERRMKALARRSCVIFPSRLIKAGAESWEHAPRLLRGKLQASFDLKVLRESALPK